MRRIFQILTAFCVLPGLALCAQFDSQGSYAGILLLGGGSGGGSGSAAETDPLKSQGWTLRRTITFSNSSRGVLTNITLPVMLNSTRIDYGQTQDAGQDIRFVDADGATLLPYEIEKWDESGQSTVWVQVPQIDASDADLIYVYYGNSSAGDNQSTSGAWDSNFVGVWHFGEDPGGAAPQFSDRSTSGHSGTATSLTGSSRMTSTLGYGLDFPGTTGHVNVSHTTNLQFSGDLTFEAYLNRDSAPANFTYIVEKGLNDQDNYGWLIRNNGRIGFEFRDTAGGYIFQEEAAASVTNGTWYYLTVTYEQATRTLTFYNNTTQTHQVVTANAIRGTETDDLRVGRQNFGGNNFYWDGMIDELRMSNTVRSSDYFSAQYSAIQDGLMTYGTEEVL